MDLKTPLNVFRIIGDVHGKHQKLVEIASQAKYSLALGDIGFDYHFLKNNFSSDNHKMIGGNHDNYSKDATGKYLQTQHFLGDYGAYKVPQFGEIFYIRGGYSVDKNLRTPGKNWFDDEQLSSRDLYNCVEAYSAKKPWFVVSHECPSDLVSFFATNSMKLDTSKTAQALQSMFEIHQPKYWFFGHHHKTSTIKEKGTTFCCLGELEYYDFPLQGAS